MAEIVWPGTRMFTSLSGDKEVARSHKRDARILIGYLLGTTSDLRPYAYRTVRLADGSIVQAHVWRGNGVARAKVRIWSPSFEKKEEGELIYGLLLWVTTLENPFGFKKGAGTPITEPELAPIDENDIPLARLKPYTLLTHEKAKWTVRRPTVAAAYNVGQRVWCGVKKEDVLSWDGTYVYYKYAVVFEMNDLSSPFAIVAAGLYRAQTANDPSYLMLLTSRAQIRWYEWTGEKISATDTFSFYAAFSLSLSTTGCNFSASATKLGAVNTVPTPAARVYSFNPLTASWTDDGSVGAYTFNTEVENEEYVQFPIAVDWDKNEQLVVATVKAKLVATYVDLVKSGIIWWDVTGLGYIYLDPVLSPAERLEIELAFNDVVADTICAGKDEAQDWAHYPSPYIKHLWAYFAEPTYIGTGTLQDPIYVQGWAELTNLEYDWAGFVTWEDADTVLSTAVAGYLSFIYQNPAFWPQIHANTQTVTRVEAFVGENREHKLLQVINEDVIETNTVTTTGTLFTEEEKTEYWVQPEPTTLELRLRYFAKKAIGQGILSPYAVGTSYGVPAERAHTVNSLVSSFWGRALVSTIPDLQQQLRISGTELATSANPTIGVGISLS